ncbi:GAF and ANTAR domain-containing protein [Amycolatopsis rhabdoformis]|uniref:GAF and ANTAR domain-containing protein n=1 Tax=Amycolatopsis rhabdoformis TaxID=1448059 RepID=A0ABZ1ILI9_9PSEU|nr:GAF and ANTAR domain-containing protein [Amycolatopsis rhabdoformis]WSE34653.1 GAF and ANTAR domain-containing protein [Amycolatopsis rhabdoformis]
MHAVRGVPGRRRIGEGPEVRGDPATGPDGGAGFLLSTAGLSCACFEVRGFREVEERPSVIGAPSHALVAELDRLQSELGEGPCLSAIRDESTVRVPDFAKPDQPWPLFATAATERGVRSLLAMRLFVHHEILGALNLYARRPDSFTADSEILADLVAQHAAVALAGANRAHHLNVALASRDILGQAKGILMQRDNLTSLQAFATLVRASQDTNMKVLDVARWLVTQAEDRARS